MTRKTDTADRVSYTRIRAAGCECLDALGAALGERAVRRAFDTLVREELGGAGAGATSGDWVEAAGVVLERLEEEALEREEMEIEIAAERAWEERGFGY